MDYLKTESTKIQNYLESDFIVDGEILTPPKNFERCTRFCNVDYGNPYSLENTFDFFEIIMKKIIKPFFGKDKVTPICIKFMLYQRYLLDDYITFEEYGAFIYSEIDELSPFIRYYISTNNFNYFLNTILSRSRNIDFSIEIIKKIYNSCSDSNIILHSSDFYGLSISDILYSKATIEMCNNHNFILILPMDEIVYPMRNTKYFVAETSTLILINSIQRNLYIEMSPTYRNLFRCGRVLSVDDWGDYSLVKFKEKKPHFILKKVDFLDLESENTFDFLYTENGFPKNKKYRNSKFSRKELYC